MGKDDDIAGTQVNALVIPLAQRFDSTEGDKFRSHARQGLLIRGDRIGFLALIDAAGDHGNQPIAGNRWDGERRWAIRSPIVSAPSGKGCNQFAHG